ncbi:MAG: imidazole glycerol phosphate synthase subunit HisH [Candidatus Saganbacteria bacterium]|nr:imidazole glycerol phosphate synthase subunit HisH [Candidatus Saganbacteria bacterium]
MSIAIIDYGAGNLRSVQKALEKLGCDSSITDDIKTIDSAKGIILPGVGAFDPAMNELKKKSLLGAIISNIAKKKPFLGLCLGMQLLFDESEEGKESGLGVIKGKVRRFNFTSRGLKIPHMGWNEIDISKPSPIFKGLDSKLKMYFVHSYYCVPSDEKDILARTDYGTPFVSAVSKDNTFALQFHPEKSGDAGLKILKNFGEMCK